MKLPRLSNPTTIVYTENSEIETIKTEITVGSQFDLLPTWIQYSLLGTILGLTRALLIFQRVYK